MCALGESSSSMIRPSHFIRDFHGHESAHEALEKCALNIDTQLIIYSIE